MSKKRKTPANNDAPTSANEAPPSRWWRLPTAGYSAEGRTPSEMFRRLWLDGQELAAMMEICQSCLQGKELLHFNLCAGLFAEQLDGIAKTAAEACLKLQMCVWAYSEEGQKALDAAKEKFGPSLLVISGKGGYEIVPNSKPEEVEAGKLPICLPVLLGTPEEGETGKRTTSVQARISPPKKQKKTASAKICSPKKQKKRRTFVVETPPVEPQTIKTFVPVTPPVEPQKPVSMKIRSPKKQKKTVSMIVSSPKKG